MQACHLASFFSRCLLFCFIHEFLVLLNLLLGFSFKSQACNHLPALQLHAVDILSPFSGGFVICAGRAASLLASCKPHPPQKAPGPGSLTDLPGTRRSTRVLRAEAGLAPEARG